MSQAIQAETSKLVPFCSGEVRGAERAGGEATVHSSQSDTHGPCRTLTELLNAECHVTVVVCVFLFNLLERGVLAIHYFVSNYTPCANHQLKILAK